MVKAVQELGKKNDDQQKEITALKASITKLAPAQTTNAAAGGVLEQNIPNPGTGSTSIHYTLPQGTHIAQLLIIDNVGRTIKAVQLTTSGAVTIDTNLLSSGIYNYTLIVDNKVIDTKKMTIAR